MRPVLGWTLLSREELRHAERALASDEQGVRDEIGFLALHQGYADRFFPGTSVLQTRLRYVLFVPWIYQRIERENLRPVTTQLPELELKLVKRLKDGNQEGIIGGRAYPSSTSQPAAMVYWSALGRWGILRRQNGALPSRKAVHRYLERTRISPSPRDSDDEPLESGVELFCRLPSCPLDWNRDTPLTFEMTNEEHQFVRNQLLSVVRDVDGKATLLAKLADERIYPDKKMPWSRSIISMADGEDRRALKRARQAASLAAIGRAAYAALLEQQRDEDGFDTPRRHRDHLEVMFVRHRDKARALEVDAMIEDVPGLVGRHILAVLRETRRWLERQGKLGDLYALYAEAEKARKGERRARLGHTLGATKLRADWDPAAHPLASPLRYRWNNVCRLLHDLVTHGIGPRNR